MTIELDHLFYKAIRLQNRSDNKLSVHKYLVCSFQTLTRVFFHVSIALILFQIWVVNFTGMKWEFKAAQKKWENRVEKRHQTHREAEH